MTAHESALSRRTFVKGSLAGLAMAGASGAALYGCAPQGQQAATDAAGEGCGRPDRLEPVQRQLRRQLRLPMAQPRRQDRLHGDRQHRRRRPAGPCVPARALHAPLDQPPRPPDEAHEARGQARRGQVRGDQLGRGHRHHRRPAQVHHPTPTATRPSTSSTPPACTRARASSRDFAF